MSASGPDHHRTVIPFPVHVQIPTPWRVAITTGSGLVLLGAGWLCVRAAPAPWWQAILATCWALLTALLGTVTWWWCVGGHRAVKRDDARSEGIVVPHPVNRRPQHRA